MSGLSDALKQRRSELGYTLAQVADMVGVTEATVQRWESGNIKALRHGRIAKLAEALNVSPAYLMGWEEPNAGNFPSNLMPMPKMNKIPLLGQIACGVPILAEENITDHIDLPEHINADFALRCNGDSMIGAGINDGDIVYVRHQPEVFNGQIAAVIVGDDEATLKRFYRDGNTVMLNAENPSFAPMVFVNGDINKLRIVGRAIAYTHVIK